MCFILHTTFYSLINYSCTVDPYSYEHVIEVGNVALRVNTQNIKVEFQKILLFFLTVFFCCDVGESDLILKPRYGSFNVIYRKSQFNSISYSLILGLSWKTDIRSVIKSL